MVQALYDSSKKKQKVIVMIPAFNEEKNIARVISGVPRSIAGVSEVEVMVMDDHSSDRTAEFAKKAGADYVFRQKQNTGLGGNFKKGIEIALKLGADIIVNIDGDGQFDSRDVPTLIAPILAGEADMVTCSRFLDMSKTKNMPLARRIGNFWFTKLVSKITGEKFSDTQCGFRAYSKDAGLKLNLKGKFTYTQEVFIDLVEKGMRIKEVPLNVVYHTERKSMISGNLKRYGFKSLGIIAKTTRDTQPLTFFGGPALLVFLLGFIGGLYSLIYWLMYHATTPVRTLFNVSIFFMTFGLALGILALVADMLKTIKVTQDEVLYRLKKSEVDHGQTLDKINGNVERVQSRVEDVNGKMQSVNGAMKKVQSKVEHVNGRVEKMHSNVEKVNGAVKKVTSTVAEIAQQNGNEPVEEVVVAGFSKQKDEKKRGNYYSRLEDHKRRMRSGL